MSQGLISQMGQLAKEASISMAQASTAKKNAALAALADFLLLAEKPILEANADDRTTARSNELPEVLIDRLSLKDRIPSLVEDVRHVKSLADPIGEEFDQTTLPNGLKVSKRRTPLGVLGVIYESRPNVTVDVAALAIKSGNCAILRGGSETLETNLVLLGVIQKALESAGLPGNAIQMIPANDREHVKELLHLHESIDLIIPRGGAKLHQFCRENSLIPVITGGIGICHLFADQSTDQKKALEVIFNAKTQRPTVCNALDTLLVHREIADTFIPQVIQRLEKAGVSFRLDPIAWKIMENASYSGESLSQAHAEDWDMEWLSLVLGIKVVHDMDEAIQHIRKHSTGHSDGILTEDKKQAEQFLNAIDSAAVYVNASTRFTDGGQLGLGAEVAISTQKLHARGPMGLKELTTYKWIIQGDYHTRQ